MRTDANCLRVFAQYFKVTNVLIESRISQILNRQQASTLPDIPRNFHLSGKDVKDVHFFSFSYLYAFSQVVPAEAAVEDISEPKTVVAPSEAPLSELGFSRQLLKDGGEEKVVPAPGRNDGSEKLRKSEEEAAEGALVALVSSRPA